MVRMIISVIYQVVRMRVNNLLLDFVVCYNMLSVISRTLKWVKKKVFFLCG